MAAETGDQKGKTLLDALNELYEQYGYYKEALISLTFEGLEGQQKIARIMENFREYPPTTIAGIEVSQVEDYLAGQVNGLPKADVVKFILMDGSWICVRPSGTEPKCKFYIGVCHEQAEAQLEKIALHVDEMIKQIH